MALDLTGHEAESAEIVALKERVIQVSRRHATAHNLCGVVDRALEEAGITDTTRVPVEIDATLNVKIQAGLLPGELVNKSEEEQNAWVQEQLKGALAKIIETMQLQRNHGLAAVTNVLVPVTGRHGQYKQLMKVEGVVVNEMNNLPEPPQPTGNGSTRDVAIQWTELNRDQRWAFSSRDGRVAHVVTNGVYTTGGRSACGATRSFAWTDRSARSENRACTNCVSYVGVSRRD